MNFLNFSLSGSKELLVRAGIGLNYGSFFTFFLGLFCLLLMSVICVVLCILIVLPSIGIAPPVLFMVVVSPLLK